MRLLKYILVMLLLAVSAAFTVTEIGRAVTGKADGPVFACDQEVLEISVKDGQQKLMEGISASDRQDGDLTAQVMVAAVSQLITDDTARVTYLVFDSHDNMAQYQRMVRYTDYRKPVISLTEPLVFAVENTSGILDRLSARDVIDGDISDRIRLSSLWATDRADLYSLTVTVTNSMGDTSRVELPVMIQPELIGRPVINLRNPLVYVEQGSAFDPMDHVASMYVRDQRVSAGDLTVDSQVDSGQPGCYWVIYSYDAEGIQGTAVLTVVVQ